MVHLTPFVFVLTASLAFGQSTSNDTASSSSTATKAASSPQGPEMLAQPIAAVGPSVMSLSSLLGPAQQVVAIPYAAPVGPDVVMSMASAPPMHSVESKTPEPAPQEVGTGRRAMKVALPQQMQPMADAPMPPAPAPPMTMIDMLSPPPRPMPVMAQEKLQNDTVMVPQVMPPAPQAMPPAPQAMSPVPLSGPELLSPPLPAVAVLPPAIKMPEMVPVASLPDDATTLKALIAKRDESIKALTSENAELRAKLERPGPIGIMPPFSLQSTPTCNCGGVDEAACANLMRMQTDELEGTKDRLRQLENKYGEFIEEMSKKQNSKKPGKPVKKQIEIIVQKKKSAPKKGKSGKQIKLATVNPNTGCQSMLENEKSVTTALQSGINERDIQITSLQEMLKNAEDRVTIVQNAEINSCNVKLQNSASELNSCREDIKSLKRLTSNCGERYSDENGDGENNDDDDDDEEDENDSEIMSLVQKIMANGKKGKVAVINFNKNGKKFNKRIVNKIPIITLGDKEYSFHNNSRVNWYQASSLCEKRKMRLISIEHDEENAMVSTEILNTAGVFWTSGRDISGNGDFEWTAIKRSFNNFLN